MINDLDANSCKRTMTRAQNQARRRTLDTERQKRHDGVVARDICVATVIQTGNLRRLPHRSDS